jgi:hypothetical protein
MLALGAPRGCQLPDAILHGKRSLRPRSRAVQRFTVAEFRVRLFSSLELVVAPPVCEPGKDTSMTAFSASPPFSTRSAPAFSRTLALCHGSRLLTLRLPFIHRPAVSFLISPAFRKVFTGLAWTACPSRRARSLCPAFRRLSFGGDRFRGAARVARPC